MCSSRQVGDRGEKAIEALEQVKIARPRERYHAYPFELSGGMCQRVVIALALACNPQLLIADEPTTGLDVTTQKAVMDLIVELTKRRGMSTILITHDLGLAAAYCDRVVVMEKGRVVETALSADIFAKPEHAYTKKLMRATPRLGVSLRDLLPEEEAAALPPICLFNLAPLAGRGRTCAAHPGEGDSPQTALADGAPHPDPLPAKGGERETKPLLLVEKLVKEYPRQGATATLGKLFSRKPPVELEKFRAVDGISFSVGHGESVGLVGEVRLRQIHHLDDGDAAIGPDLGPHHVRRRRDRQHPAQCVCAAAAAQEHPDGVSGSDRQPQSALYGGARHRRSDHAARRHQGTRRACAPAARNWPAWSACRSTCSIVSRINCRAARRPASASRAPSRCIPSWSFSTSRPRRSTSRCRRWC